MKYVLINTENVDNRLDDRYVKLLKEKNIPILYIETNFQRFNEYMEVVPDYHILVDIDIFELSKILDKELIVTKYSYIDTKYSHSMYPIVEIYDFWRE